MGVIRTNAAAAMLGVSPNTLRSWERRFGYPEPRRTAGGHRQFDLAEIEALRRPSRRPHNVSSAVSIARDRGEGPATGFRLRTAFARFDELAADRVLEESLAVRSVERTVDEMLLPGVEALDAGGDADGLSAEYAFAWRWATGWLAAQTRVAPAATRAGAVVLFDASAPCDVDALHAQALELGLRRRGGADAHAGRRPAHRARRCPDADRLERALRAVPPSAVVLIGRRASLDALGRLVFAARRSGGDRVGVYDFRGALPDTGATTVPRLGARAIGACDALAEHLDGRGPERARRGAGVALRQSALSGPRRLAHRRSVPSGPGTCPAPMSLLPGDPLAHRALDSLLRAEASVRRRLTADLEREGLSGSGFSVLVVLTTAGGELRCASLRQRLRTSKANATEIVTTLDARGLRASARGCPHDRRAAASRSPIAGASSSTALFPEHTERVGAAFAVLDERREALLAEVCRKLAA